MCIYRFELRRGRLALIIWSAAISLMLAFCILLFPLMQEAMESVNAMMQQMEGFSEMMSVTDYSDFTQYFFSECGELLGLGAALFAAILGGGMLAKEQKDKTAEFLLTHPISRARVTAEKLAALFTQLLILNLAVALVSALSMVIIQVKPDVPALCLLFTAYFLLQAEVASLAFCLSAFLRKGSIGLSLGLVALFYFMNLLSGLLEQLNFLCYLTPYGFTGMDILREHTLNTGALATGAGLSAAGIVLAFLHYRRKDIL